VAVGVYQTLLTVVVQQTLVESWNGTSWSIVASPDPNDADSLQDVSCTSSTTCVAVGDTFTAGQPQTLIESWDGTSWSVTSSPNPTTHDLLSGVTCTSASSCLAVGEATLTTLTLQEQTLVESWDGTSWSIVSSPNHGTDTSQLQAISCVSSTFCQAVGLYFDETTKTELTLIESWDGTNWSLVSSTPNAGILDLLGAVSCPDTSHCEVVGSFLNSSDVSGSLILTGLDGDLALTGVPSNISVDATTPAGATASFTAPVATDEETPPGVTCDHTSGVTYPIGTTTVTCSTTDSDDIPSTVTASFTVTVNGATGQLNDLLTYAGPLPPGHSFGDDVQAALNDVAGKNTSGACAQLASLITLANSQSGKKLTTAQAAHILAAATQIEQVLGC
jgi:hypothetical protein